MDITCSVAFFRTEIVEEITYFFASKSWHSYDILNEPRLQPCLESVFVCAKNYSQNASPSQHVPKIPLPRVNILRK
jgi:hypothetical protein